MAMSTLVLAAPFVASGIAITLALTRTAGPMGRLYGADLLGAATGCLAHRLDPGAHGHHVDGVRRRRLRGDRRAVFRALGQRPDVSCRGRGRRAGGDGRVERHVRISRSARSIPKSRNLWFLRSIVDYSGLERALERDRAGADREPRVSLGRLGQGAGVSRPEWRGRRSTAWPARPSRSGRAGRKSSRGRSTTSTSLAYRLRNGRAGVIGVGGGRDMLTGLAFRNRVGHRHRDQPRPARRRHASATATFAGIADAPGVRLVHDEARSYLTRAGEQFDVLADVAHRYLGGDGRRARSRSPRTGCTRVKAGACFSNSLTPDRHLHRLALVRAAGRLRDDAAARRSAWRRCSTPASPSRART